MYEETYAQKLEQRIKALLSGRRRLHDELATATEELKRLRFRADFLESKRAEETAAFSRILTELHGAVDAHRDIDKSIIADIPPGEGMNHMQEKIWDVLAEATGVKYHGR